jgi:hypothetical protein
MRKRFVGLVLAGVVGACSPVAPSPSLATPTAAAPTENATVAATVAATGSATEPAMTVAPIETAPLDTGSGGTPACAPDDLKVSHGLVEDADGSRSTDVVLEPANTCSVDAFPAFSLRDATGAMVVEGASASPGATDLVGGVAYTSTVGLANWCEAEAVFPVSLQLLVDGSDLFVSGGSFPEEDNPPTCDNDGAPTLKAAPWTPAP